MSDLHEWSNVSRPPPGDDAGLQEWLDRCRVPGGWLYRATTLAVTGHGDRVSVALEFVADDSEERP